MQLIHRGKTSHNVVPLDAELALKDDAFATYTEQTGAEAPRHVALGWTLISTQTPGEDGKRPKYQDNTFELRIGAEHLDRMIEALKLAKKRFKSPTVPGLAVPEIAK